MKKLLLYIIMCTVMVACSEVELCETAPADHPHSSTVRFEFDWSKLQTAGIGIPDTMGVVNYRVVNNWKRLLKLTTDDLQGTFVKIEDGKPVSVTFEGSGDSENSDNTGNTGDTENFDNQGNVEGTTNEEDVALTADDDNSGLEVDGSESSDDSGNSEDSEDSGNSDSSDNSEASEEPAAPARILPGDPTPTPVRDFTVKPGDYKFMAFAYDTTEVDLSEVYRFISTPPVDMAMADIAVTYRTYAMDDKRLKNKLTGWDDYNGYALFLQPELTPVIYDTTDIVSIARDAHATVTLTPNPVSQNVDVYLNIVKGLGENNKYAFVIDSIWAEISGVARRVNLADSKLDIANTGKMMFPMEMWLTPIDGVSPRPSEDNCINYSTITDQPDNERVYCHANIDVTGIVPPKASEDGTQEAKDREYGPGIMQLIIFTHYNERIERKEVRDDDGNLVMQDVKVCTRRRLQGKANLYYPLTREPSIKLSENQSAALRAADHINLRFDTSIPLSGEDITDPNTEGDVLRWKWYEPEPGQGDDVIIEI